MKKLMIVFVVCVLLALAGCSSGASSAASGSSSSSPSVSASASSSSKPAASNTGVARGTADTVFGYPEQKSVRGGTVGVFQASSGDCTVENLTTWYNQYPRWGIDDWCIIVFTDKPGYGVYAGAGMVDVNAEIDENYMEADSGEATMYVFKAPDEVSVGELVLIG